MSLFRGEARQRLTDSAARRITAGLAALGLLGGAGVLINSAMESFADAAQQSQYVGMLKGGFQGNIEEAPSNIEGPAASVQGPYSARERRHDEGAFQNDAQFDTGLAVGEGDAAIALGAAAAFAIELAVRRPRGASVAN